MTTKLYRKTISVDLSVEADDIDEARRIIFRLAKEVATALPVGARFDPARILDHTGKATGVYRV